MTNLIATDVQGQAVDSPIVDLFELTLPDGTEMYFHPGVDQVLTDVEFRNLDTPSNINQYTAIPMIMDGLDIQSDGAASRPTLTIANVTSVLDNALGDFKYDDLIGQNVIRRQTLQKYLYGESGDVNPPIELNKVKYKIDRIASESNVAITFELAVAYDLQGIQIPRRVVVGKYCSWMYQGHALHEKGGCIWKLDGGHKEEDSSGTSRQHNMYFNIDDKPLVLTSWLTTNSSNWAATSVSYTQNSYVSYSSKYWQCQIVHTSDANKAPSDTSLYWKEAKPYVVHANNTSYSLGVCVLYSNTIWRAITAHVSDANNTPKNKSKFWVREDMCGKTLNSCKCRFQAIVTDNSVAGSPPSSKKDTRSTLPFGSFPGTAKF